MCNSAQNDAGGSVMCHCRRSTNPVLTANGAGPVDEGERLAIALGLQPAELMPPVKLPRG